LKGIPVAKRRREIKTYKYECNLTGEQYTLTKKVDNADDLMSVTAFYEMQPDKDDRPMDIKKRLGLLDKKEEAPAKDDEETEEASE
jgi:hypothetical protein